MVNKQKEPVVAELNRIYKRDGKITPSVVLREAKNKKSPLHNEFEWDDEKCGVEYRLIQARQLLRAKVTYRDDEGKPTVTLPVFHHVPSTKAGEGEYHTAEVLVEHPDLYMRALGQARESLKSASASFKHLEKMAREGGKEENVVAIIGIAERGLATAMEAVSKIAAA